MSNFIKRNWSALVFILLLSIGLYLRVGGVITNSFAFTYDVGRDLLEVQRIVQNFDVPLIGQTTGLGGLYYGPWWYYILTPPFIISEGDPQGIAFFMVLNGLLTIALGYVFGKMVEGKKLGLIMAGFLSFSTVMVGLSNQIWNPNIAPLLLLALLICVFMRIKNKKKRVIQNILIGILLGLLLDSEIVFGVLVLGGISISLLFFERKRFFSIEKIYIVLGLLFMLLPRIIFELRHNFIMLRSLFIEKNEDQQVLDLYNFFNVLPDRLNIFINQVGDTFGLPYFISIILCISIIFSWILFRKEQKDLEKKICITLSITIITFLMGSSLFARAIWGHYLVGLPVLYILFVSLILRLIMRKLLYVGIGALLILLVSSIRPDGIIAGVTNPYWEGNAAVYRNQVEVIDFIYKDANGRKFNYIVYTPAVHDYPYQYLFSWYGKNKYGYTPSENTEKLFYVIIEPDPGYEGRIVDWLKIREGDGEIVDEDIVKGGISVQERKR